MEAQGNDYQESGVDGGQSDENTRHNEAVVDVHPHCQSLPKNLLARRTAVQGHGLERRYQVLVGAKDVPSSANWRNGQSQKKTLSPAAAEGVPPC